MELKRFVLLNTGRIYDMTFNYDVKCYDTVKNGNKETFGLKKTSDNIFDLVEVGDLIEIKDSPYLHRVYEQIYKGLNNQVLSFIYMTIHTTGQYLLSEVNKDVIISIYKCQTNGDYKRYEIGGKE